MSDAFEVRVKPVVQRDGRLRVSANVGQLRHSINEIWFELDDVHRDALVDRADPFVVAALVLAMSSQRTMRISGAPVSASLVHNLEEFQLVWHAWYGFPVVDIVAEVEVDTTEREAAAITAFTGGVDSAFSAYRHSPRRTARSVDLQAGMINHGVDVPRADVEGFRGAAARSARMLDSIDVELVTVTTNAWELQPADARYVAIGVAAGLHLFGARFGTALIPSTADDAHAVLPMSTNALSDPMLGSASTLIVHDGGGYDRLDKLRVLAEWDEALTSLRVCLRDPHHDRNCGVCVNCMITLLGFRVLGVVPTCFGRMPTDDDFHEWASALPNQALFRNEARSILDEVRARGIDAPWGRVPSTASSCISAPRMRPARLRPNSPTALPPSAAARVPFWRRQKAYSAHG